MPQLVRIGHFGGISRGELLAIEGGGALDQVGVHPSPRADRMDDLRVRVQPRDMDRCVLVEHHGIAAAQAR